MRRFLFQIDYEAGEVSEFPTVQQAIQNGINRNLHTCVQIFVSVDGEIVLNQGFGQATPETKCDHHTVMLWRSAGKPLTAAAICHAWQQKKLSLQDQVGDLLTQTAGAVRNKTIRELLIHESGLPIANTGWPQSDWSAIVSKILAAKETTSDAAYQPQSSWFVLGEILRHVDTQHRPFAEILRQDLLLPLGMKNSYCGIPKGEVSSLPLPNYYVRERGKVVPSDFDQAPWLTAASPGGNLRGPVSDLGRFYEMMLAKGIAHDGQRFFTEQTVAAMTATHRRSKFDTTLQHIVDMGLGFHIDSNLHGSDTVPYGFSEHCSEESFGHGGSQCAIGFCDPPRKLVVAWAANGFCGEGQHQRRNRDINQAVYQDLGMAKT